MARTGSNLINLREAVERSYTLEELQALTFDLSIPYQNLSGATLSTKVISLIEYTCHHGLLDELEQKLKKDRPKTNWDEIDWTQICPNILPADPDADAPYQGLRFFDVTDTDRYFGRDALIADLIGRIMAEDLGFLMLVGASGSGKSSLVRAGIVPTLKGDRPQQKDTMLPAGSQEWPLHIITPNKHPLKELSISLTAKSESVTAATTLIEDMEKNHQSLDIYVTRMIKGTGGDKKLLLIIDQFEELFTECQDEAERETFVHNLMAAADRDSGCPIIIICTIRADFYHRLLEYEALRAVLPRNQENIGPMTREELKESIEQPATAGGWDIDAGLTETILKDVESEPGALPLLSHALLATWENRRGRTLTNGGYVAAGGVGGAIRQTAERFYKNKNKSEEDQELIRKIFIRLATLGEGQADTRKRVEIDWLLSIDDGHRDEIRQLITQLANARLLTTSGNIAEISHEALLREWPTLRQWLDTDRETLRIYNQLADATKVWLEHGKNSEYHLSGAQLTQAVAIQDELEEFTNDQERVFLSASKRAARRSTLIGWALVGAGVSLIFALIAVGFFFNQQRQIEQLKRSNQAKLLAMESRLSLQNDNNVMALKLAVAADLLSSQPETKSALINASFKIDDTLVSFEGHSDMVHSAVFSPLGDRVLTASSDETAKLWDLDGNELVSFDGHSGKVNSAIFNPAGDRVLTASSDGTAKLWDLDGNLLISFEGHSSVLWSAVFNPAGDRVLTYSNDHTAILWSLEGTQLISIQTYQDFMKSPMFSSTGEKILFNDHGGTVKIFDLEKVLLTPIESHSSPLNFFTFSPTGSHVLTASDDGSVKIWDLSGNLLSSFNPHSNSLKFVVFSSSGDRILTASDNGMIKLLDLDGNLVFSFDHTDSITAAIFSPSGDRILTVSRGASGRILDLDGNLLSSFYHTGFITPAPFNPTEDRVLTTSLDGTAKLWPVDYEIMTVAQQTLEEGFSPMACGTIFPDEFDFCPMSKEELFSFGQ